MGSAVDNEVLNSLAEKLESLDLSDEEQGALDAVISRAAAAEVEVQGFRWEGTTAGLSPMGLKLGAAVGRFGGVTRGPFEMARPEMARPEIRFNPTEM